MKVKYLYWAWGFSVISGILALLVDLRFAIPFLIGFGIAFGCYVWLGGFTGIEIQERVDRARADDD